MGYLFRFIKGESQRSCNRAVSTIRTPRLKRSQNLQWPVLFLSQRDSKGHQDHERQDQSPKQNRHSVTPFKLLNVPKPDRQTDRFSSQSMPESANHAATDEC